MVRVLLLRMDSADVFLLDCDMLVVRCLRDRGDFCEPIAIIYYIFTSFFIYMILFLFYMEYI